MDTSLNNDLITRPDSMLGRVISSAKLRDAVKGIKRIKRSHRQIRTENVFKKTLVIVALSTVVLVLGIMVTLAWQSTLSIKASGLSFLWGKVWDPVQDIFGAYPFILGTLLTSFTALIISIPFSFAVGIFLGEYFPNGLASNFLKNTVELIAAVPSVIYGFWGLAVLVPIVRSFETSIGVAPVGLGIFTSSLILAIMIIPFIASVMRDVFEVTPPMLKESAYGLGSTTWEVVYKVVLPYTKAGVVGGIMLGLGRALGETMAVTIVIGNFNQLNSLSLFEAASSITSALANEFAEAGAGLHQASLIYLGLILFFITFVVLALSRWMLSHLRSREGSKA